MLDLFSFDGRNNRRQFWLTHLLVNAYMVIIIFPFLYITALAVKISGENEINEYNVGWSKDTWITILILMTPYIWIAMASNIKRIHDLGFSGEWLLFYIVPVIGPICLIYALGFVPGEPCANRYGGKISFANPFMAEIEKDEAFAWLRALRSRAAVTGLVTLVLVAVLAFRSSRRATMPLKELAAVAREVSEGHFENRLGTLRGREPQEVANAFNSMLDGLAAAQRDLVQAASLATIGELSSSIVHEMRNPLSSVKMNIKALHERVADDAMYAELASIGSGQVERLEQMLNDLLQYGKPVKLQVDQVVVGDLFNDVAVALAGLSKDSGVVLRCEDSTGGHTVRVDGEQLRRAVTNLVDNAIRVSSSGSCVTLSGSIRECERGEEFVVCVEDVGPGLSETVQARLFEPFFTARRDGTGLGLANVRKIVELHGGTVTGENRSDGGARFTVKLPRGCVS